MAVIPQPVTPYVAATIPAQVQRVSGTTLFHMAAFQFDNALQWVPIAQLNAMIDPWIGPLTNVDIPPVLPTGTPNGLLLVTPGGATAGF